MRDSIDQMLEARSRELEAHFEALQSQMDPHFLFNSLMAISSVAREADAPVVVEMCDCLSRMLRYTASHKQSSVDIADEWGHAVNYIRMMKLRYEDFIEAKFDLDDSLAGIRVPKLILQPLVENAFSHGFANATPPYCVAITGTRTERTWALEIKDNGGGFSPSALRRIEEQFRKHDTNLSNHDFSNQLEIGGMTVSNVYIRLKMLYGQDAVFEISNNSQGATVKIGGTIVRTEGKERGADV
ncbi:sensor histidine kinase [Cohnella rhizosphaerae]|uniref:Histidine kinase n=1 Tax=Cohnella rhizosphaerae TaxID=1457232 RepID=A0A9X4L5H9_9BACL|nr:histidine kinase [Cohnella rhizosphaerae]MDG0813847.1 histidine kinase [Cohnella rhizosphaerae]